MDGNDITYTVDDLTNRYTSVADANLTYDAAGDLTKDKDGYEYEYDYENRIIRITRDPNDIVVAEYSYDALGRRIEKKDLIDPNNTTRYYYNNNWQVLCEYDGAGSYKKLFVYGNYIDEVLYTQGPGPPSRRYYIHDHLYSPVALVYATGAVIERYEYDAYGNCYVLEPNFAPDSDGESNYGNPYLFTGRRVDILDSGSLKIQYNRNRYYDYYTGRWLTHDPMGINPGGGSLNIFLAELQYTDGLNLYNYVKSRPTISLDPYGLLAWPPDPSEPPEPPISPPGPVPGIEGYIVLNVPATQNKCDLVNTLITLGTLRSITDMILWKHYKEGTGDYMELPMWSFGYTVQQEFKSEIKVLYYDPAMNAARALPCESSDTFIDYTYYGQKEGQSTANMISRYDMKAWFSIDILNRESSLESVFAKVFYHFVAFDITDFNPGSDNPFLIPPNILIYDDLVIACDLGESFGIGAEQDSRETWVGPCTAVWPP